LNRLRLLSICRKEIATLLDFGSGGGLPGIPIALCRPPAFRDSIAVTLAESQRQESRIPPGGSPRVLGISAKVHADRAEVVQTVFDCVILRAVEKMPLAVAAAVKLVAPDGWLALMTTDSGTSRATVGRRCEQFRWKSAHPPARQRVAHSRPRPENTEARFSGRKN
jgi:16S rRNA G527 N7-methylase RsmG